MSRLFNRVLLITAFALSTQWAAAQNESYFLHTVTKGQGLYSISRMYGVTEADIIRLNPGSEVVIKAGEQLRIPQTKQVQSDASSLQKSTANERFQHRRSRRIWTAEKCLQSLPLKALPALAMILIC